MNKHQIKSHFVYGYHTVSAILKFQPERAKKLLLARKTDLEPLINLAKAARIEIEYVDRSFLEQRFLVGSDAQGIVLLCSPFMYADLDSMLNQRVRRLLVLDSWQDAANLGRAARAALCFGAEAMIITKDRSADITAASEKSAVGALARVPVIRVVNLAQALKKIKETGFFVYGADERADVALKKCDFAPKAALVIGQEGEGLRELTKKHCDMLVGIPMANTDICLNAADTALLLLYELYARGN